MHQSQIRELMLYKLQLNHKIDEAIKNIFAAKDEGAFDYNTVTRLFKKFYLGWENLDDQARSGRPQTVAFKAAL